ncbi:MAG: peptidyl-prolyl cis-trans isomerase, partial [Burkholderiales bacterium]|nr:peptidyl-prolyl cis-trans isomerase [Opitutaceae bacterium]
DEQTVAHIQTLRAFAGPSGQFDPKLYADFIDSLKTNPRLSEGDASRVISEDTRVAAYEKLLAGPGYVLPSDVADILAQRDTTWTLAIASIDGSAFAPRIDTSDTALQAWFEINSRNYEIAPRASAAALVIPAAKFADSVNLSEPEIRAAYDANPSRYPAPPAAKEIKLDPATGKDLNADAAYLSARPLVEADLRKQRAEDAALQAASDLAVRLLEQDVKPADLAAFVAKQPDLSLVEVGPIGTGAIPAALGGNSVSAAILPEAQRLSADRPYSNPVTVPNGAALLVWRESIPAQTPTLAEVKTTALADYQAAEKRRLFNEAGRKLQETVAASLATGKSFADAANQAATAAGLKVEIKTPAPFSLSGQFPQDMDYTAMQALQTLSKGKVSDFLPSGEAAGVLVYALDQKLPATDPTSPAYIEMRDRLATSLGQSNAQSLVSALVESELAKTAPATDTE